MAKWSGPALVLLRFDPDSRSASAIRAADPDWHRRYAPRHPRDAVTHHRLPGDPS
jgi:nicotinate-nucleotide adenylyltransferase